MRHIYILHCADDTYYTGITNDLDRRISEHNTEPKGAKYTKSRRPCTLVRSTQCLSRAEASKEEYRIKRLPRDKKLQLISTL
jgi:putative endonuclease